ncbi:hypothetical protein LPJ57_003473 [Coemansia sp. RSA 486]|nr:hypothetical protein LPJ57_003473 [Coemansia sp. RSA 486]KAJ2598666.1 hypothetical protein GGF39_002554 [Coemansia sp. RSA 1721]
MSAALALARTVIASTACVIALLVRMAAARMAAARMAAPTPRSRVSAVPDVITIVDANSVWAIQLPRGTELGHGFGPGSVVYAEFASLSFDAFSAAIAAGAVVSRTYHIDGAAEETSLARGEVAPVYMTVERLPIQYPAVAPIFLVGLLTASAPVTVERRLQAVGEVLAETLPSISVVPARSQVTFSAIFKVIRMARKPVNIQTVTPAEAAVAPRPLLVEHPAIVAAMGLVSPLTFEPPITIKTIVFPASVVPVLLGPVRKSTAQLGCSAVECAAPQAAPRTFKLSTRIAVNNNGAPAVQQKTAFSPPKPLVRRGALRASGSTARLSISSLMASKSGSAVQQRTAPSFRTRPLVEPIVLQANTPPHDKPCARTTETNISEPSVLRRTKSVFLTRPAPLSSKRSAHVVAINKDVSVRRLDEREVVEAVMKPIHLLADRHSVGGLNTASTSTSASARAPTRAFVPSSLPEMAEAMPMPRPRHFIPGARYVSISETLVDNSDSISIMSTESWDQATHENTTNPKALKGPKRIWNKTKQKMAGLKRAASTISIHRRKSMNAEQLE